MTASPPITLHVVTWCKAPGYRAMHVRLCCRWRRFRGGSPCERCAHGTASSHRCTAPPCAPQDENIPIVAKFLPDGKLTKKEAELMAPIGNSPTFLTFKQMQQVRRCEQAVGEWRGHETQATWQL